MFFWQIYGVIAEGKVDGSEKGVDGWTDEYAKVCFVMMGVEMKKTS